MIRTGLTCLVAFVVAMLGPEPAVAHRQNVAVTQVLLNPRSGSIEVAHRFALHDAEKAAFDEQGARRDLALSEPAQRDFAIYVAKRFALGDASGAPIELVLLGTQIEDGYIWIYQEAPAPQALTGLRVYHSALLDVWPEQINQVNVQRGDALQTLVFTNLAGVKTVTFDPVKPEG